MDQSQVLKKAKEYASEVIKIVKANKVILYGSYSKGTQNQDSDIDIAVIVKEVEGDYLDNEAMLYKLRRIIDDRIEPILLEEVSDDSGFLEEVLKHGIILFDSKK